LGPVHDKAGDAVAGGGVRVGFRIHQKKVGPFAAHDEPFLAVEDKMVPFVNSRGGGAEKIRPAPGLGEAFGGKDLAFEQGFDIFFLLGIGAVENDGIAHQLRPHPEGAGKDIPQHPDLLHHHAGGHPVHAPAPPLFRVPAPHQVAAAGLLQEFFGELNFVRIHIQDHLPGDGFDKFPGFLFELFLFIRQKIIKHGNIFLIFELICCTTKDTKSTKGYKTNRLMPCLSFLTLKLIRSPVLISANFM
jgi:hypothetical protein